MATLYDAQGEVIGVDFTFADLDQVMPGGTSPFELGIGDWVGEIASYELQVEGR